MLSDDIWVEIETTGEVTGTKYFGKFLIKPFLTHSERSEAYKLATKNCLGLEDAAPHRILLTTMSFLKYHIKEADANAKWWSAANGHDLFDEAPVYALSDKVGEIQASRRPKADEPAK